MPGIFVSCGVLHQEGEARNAVRLMRAACRISDEKAEVISRGKCDMVVTHHGELRSSGGSSGQGNAIVCLGSFWLSGDDSTLGTPDTLRQRVGSSWEADSPAAAGTFCYAFWDELDQRLVLETEKTGAYSLYYLEHAGGLLVSTDLRSFVDSGIHSGQFDLLGIAEYFRIGHIASDRTFFHGIRRLPVGCRLIWRHGRVQVQQVWRYKFPRRLALDDGVLDELGEILRRNLSRYANEKLRYSLTLSGGLDSRILAACAKEAGLEFETISVGPTKSLECRVAKRVASILQVPAATHEYDGEDIADWLPAMIWVTEGRCPPAHIHYFDTMFSGAYPGGPQVHGMVGDAVLGGSKYYPNEPPRSDSSTLFASCLRIVTNALNYWPRHWEKCLSGDVVDAMLGAPESVTSELLQRYEDISSEGGLEAFRYWFRGSPLLGVGLSSQVTPWVDIVCPFADPDLIRIAGQIRGEDFFERNVQYRLVYRRWPSMAQVPRIVDGISVSMSAYDPREYDKKARYRRAVKRLEYYICRFTRGRVEFYDRRGFHDYGRWYRRDPRLRELFEDTIRSSQARSRGLWNVNEIRTLRDGLRHGKNLWPALGAIVFLELYFQQLLGRVNRPMAPTQPSLLAEI